MNLAKSLLALIVIVVATTAGRAAERGEPECLSLAGAWGFALDENGKGIEKKWFAAPLPETITLPGTTDEAHKGKLNTQTKETERLSRLYSFTGAAWYQREVTIPECWKNRHVTLFLERTKVTEAWWDDAHLGRRDSLAAPQVYDLGTISTGKHRLTILVDNKNLPKVAYGPGHQISEHTQTNWNGIVGRIELRATDKVWIKDVQVYPDVKNRRIKARITLGNQTGQPASGQITLFGSSDVSASHFANAANGAVVEISYELDHEAGLWDEFSPALHCLSVGLKAKVGNETFADRREYEFGLREFATRGTQFTINGNATLLRGKHDACVFPLTGYAPMDQAAWERVFRIAKSYGINHYRFHSWCPPEAAFAAADRVGMYLQPELMYFGGNLDWVGDYPLAEAKRILAAYGNHPSFVMFTLGNEIRGARETRARIVAELRRFDGRHLYASGTNYSDKVKESNKPLEGDPLRAEGDDYWITVHTKAGVAGHIRGSYGHAEWPLGHVQTGPPATTHDYADAIGHVPVPVISHEVGQYQVFPNFKEIPKYTGVLRPWNFEVFRKRLAAKGMLDQADDFVQASGKLTALCYREEIEAALRTPGMGGFELLDLQDFPGQGTALVGILDAFMDSKGLIAPEAWREFCAPTVPLALMDKYCWTSDERFTARIKVANYGPVMLPGAILHWSLTEVGGKEVAAGSLPAQDIRQGAVVELGRVETALASATAPAKLQLTLRLSTRLSGSGKASLGETRPRGLPSPASSGRAGGKGDRQLDNVAIQNHYDLWVYPRETEYRRPGRRDRHSASGRSAQRVGQRRPSFVVARAGQSEGKHRRLLRPGLLVLHVLSSRFADVQAADRAGHAWTLDRSSPRGLGGFPHRKPFQLAVVPDRHAFTVHDSRYDAGLVAGRSCR